MSSLGPSASRGHVLTLDNTDSRGRKREPPKVKHSTKKTLRAGIKVSAVQTDPKTGKIIKTRLVNPSLMNLNKVKEKIPPKEESGSRKKLDFAQKMKTDMIGPRMKFSQDQL